MHYNYIKLDGELSLRTIGCGCCSREIKVESIAQLNEAVEDAREEYLERLRYLTAARVFGLDTLNEAALRLAAYMGFAYAAERRALGDDLDSTTDKYFRQVLSELALSYQALTDRDCRMLVVLKEY